MQRQLSIAVVLCVSFALCDAGPLTKLYQKLEHKKEQLLQDRLNALISSSVPQGIVAGNPKIAEYETFKQNANANFIHDGKGRIHFRQFRRFNLNTVMQHQF